MAKLTAEQSRKLAESFFQLSNKISEYRFSNWNDLSKEDRDTLDGLESTLRNHSSDCTAQAIILTVEDITEPITRIEEATERATAAVNALNTVRKVISIGTQAAALGVAIFTNPTGIVSVASGLLVEATG